MAYRIGRNIEASIIDYITAQLTADGWSGISVEKTFANVYKGGTPAILVNELSVSPERLEIGSKTNIKYFTIEIRIFATSDGQRLDLKDWFTDKLEDDIDYYVYTIVSGEVDTKVLTGKIVILNFIRNEKELTNTENLAQDDKYRHLISFRCYVAS